MSFRAKHAIYSISIMTFVDRCLSLSFFFVIVLPVLPRYTDSDYPFGIFKLLQAKSSVIRHDEYDGTINKLNSVASGKAIVQLIIYLHCIHSLNF
jgi:hypothetical protein